MAVFCVMYISAKYAILNGMINNNESESVFNFSKLYSEAWK